MQGRIFLGPDAEPKPQVVNLFRDRMAERYLAAYRAHRTLTGTNLDYYRVRRCVRALVEGAEGQEVWQHPLIVQDLLASIHQITNIQLTVPLAKS